MSERKDTRDRITFVVPPGTRERIEHEAHRRGLKPNQLITVLVSEWFGDRGAGATWFHPAPAGAAGRLAALPGPGRLHPAPPSAAPEAVAEPEGTAEHQPAPSGAARRHVAPAGIPDPAPGSLSSPSSTSSSREEGEEAPLEVDPTQNACARAELAYMTPPMCPVHGLRTTIRQGRTGDYFACPKYAVGGRGECTFTRDLAAMKADAATAARKAAHAGRQEQATADRLAATKRAVAERWGGDPEDDEAKRAQLMRSRPAAQPGGVAGDVAQFLPRGGAR